MIVRTLTGIAFNHVLNYNIALKSLGGMLGTDHYYFLDGGGGGGGGGNPKKNCLQ